MGIFAAIRFARKIVQTVLNQLKQLSNIVQEQAYAPMKQMAQLVQGGEIWRGEGADAFVQEVTSFMMPSVVKVDGNINSYVKNIQRAIDIIDRADEQSSKKADDLSQIFGSIYR